MTIHNDRGAAQHIRHSDCGQYDSLTTPTACQPSSPMLGGAFSPNIYRRSSLTHTSSPSHTHLPLMRTSQQHHSITAASCLSPIPKSCLGRSSPPSHTDWDLALGVPPEADKPAEEVEDMKKSRGKHAGRRHKTPLQAQIARLPPPLSQTDGGGYAMMDLRRDMRGDPRGDLWGEMMGDLREDSWQNHHSTAGEIQYLALPCIYYEVPLFYRFWIEN